MLEFLAKLLDTSDFPARWRWRCQVWFDWILPWRIGREQRMIELKREVNTLALDAMPAAIIIADATGIIVFVNYETEQLVQFKPQELIGQSVDALLPKPSRFRHAELREQILANARQRLPDGPAVLKEFVELVKWELPALLAEIRQAIEARDAKTLRRSSHTMKSSVSNFGAKPLIAIAQTMEKHGKEESIEGTSELLAAMEQEVARVLAALVSII